MSIPKVINGAILTGDIVNSTKLWPQQEARLVELLKLSMAGHKHEFYRGDSFQVYIMKPAEALRIALLCRAIAIGITEENEVPISDVRISIGIGEVVLPIGKLGVARGEAFLLSGRQFDKLHQTKQRLAISCGDPVANIGLQVMADYIDSICRKMTGRQAKLTTELLKGTTQQQAAVNLKKSTSTISQSVAASRWPEIERILKHYEDLINQLL